jgi:site-specific DNA recombinase
MTNNNQIASARAIVRKRAVGYIRVSDEKQNLKYGPKAQLEDIQKYCAEQEYELIHVVYDAITGVIWRERPGLTELRDMARRGEFDVAVAGRFDRLAREDEIQTVIMEDLVYHRVKTESATEKIEDSPAGRFMLHIYGFMAAEDRKRIIQRTDDGRRARARSGKLLGSGPARYGYKWNADRTTYLINDEVIKVDETGFNWSEAEIVKFTWMKYKEGWSIYDIRMHIQSKGIPTRNGKAIWQDSIFSRMLDWSGYTGEATVYQNKYENQLNSNGGKSRIRTIKRPEEDQIKMTEGVVPALIDRETYIVVKRLKERNKRFAARNNHDPEDALLRCGLLFCGYCGGTMIVTRHDAKRAHGTVRRVEYVCNIALKRYGKCQGIRVDSNVIEKPVWEFAVEIIRNPSLVNQALDAQKQEDTTENDLSPVDRSIDAVERKIKSYEYALDKAIESGGDREIIDGFIAKLDGLAQEKRKLEKEKKAILSKRSSIEEENQAIENFRNWCTEIREKLDDPNYTLTYKEKRRALERLGIKATVWRKDHHPRYKIEVTPDDIAPIVS